MFRRVDLVHITLFRSHCPDHIVQIILFRSYCSDHTVQITLFRSHCSDHTVPITLFRSHCSDHTVQHTHMVYLLVFGRYKKYSSSFVMIWELFGCCFTVDINICNIRVRSSRFWSTSQQLHHSSVVYPQIQG